MLNYNYIRELLNSILNIIKKENIKLYYCVNKSNNDIDMYSIYVNPFIESRELDVKIENLYILTHSINGIEYKYNNLTEEEILKLSEVLKLLDINFIKLSIPELELKKKVISKVITDSLTKIDELKTELIKLEQEMQMKDAHKKSIEISRIIKDLNTIDINYLSPDRKEIGV